MTTTYTWLVFFLALAGLSLHWRRKRQFDRTNPHGLPGYGSYWRKLRAEGFDTLLLGAGYVGLFSVAMILVAIDPAPFVWLIVIGASIYVIKNHRK